MGYLPATDKDIALLGASVSPTISLFLSQLLSLSLSQLLSLVYIKLAGRSIPVPSPEEQQLALLIHTAQQARKEAGQGW